MTHIGPVSLDATTRTSLDNTTLTDQTKGTWTEKPRGWVPGNHPDHTAAGTLTSPSRSWDEDVPHDGTQMFQQQATTTIVPKPGANAITSQNV